MTHYRESMQQTLERMYEINERKRSESIVEASMKPAQIAALKKAYEPMRGKRISRASANKLDKLMNKFAKEKDLLIQILKADIPFVSTKAATILLFKHGMEPSEINKLKEEMEFWEEVELGIFAFFFGFPSVTFSGQIANAICDLRLVGPPRGPLQTQTQTQAQTQDANPNAKRV